MARAPFQGGTVIGGMNFLDGGLTVGPVPGQVALVINGTSYGLQVTAPAATTATIGITGNAGTLSTTSFDLFQNSSNNAFIANRPAGSLFLCTNGVTPMLTINSNGTMSIATPTSGTALLVNSISGSTAISATGDIHASQQAAGTGANLFLDGAASGTTIGRIRYTSNAGGNNRFAIRDETNAQDRLQIDNNGAFTINAPAAGVALAINGISNSYVAVLTAGSTVGQSLGLKVAAGTNSSDNAVLVQNQGGTTTFLQITGAGQAILYEPSFGIAAPKSAATFDTGTFTGTLTGFAANPTGTVNYVRTGNIVSLYITADITSTSNLNAMTMTGLPTEIQPAHTVTCYCGHIENNNITNETGLASITAGTVTFELAIAAGGALISTATTNFNAASTKGLNAGWGITYPIQ